MTAVPRTRTLLFGVLVGPLAWAAQHAINYVAAPYLCGTLWRALPLVVSLAAFAITAAGLVVSRTSWRSLADVDDASDRVVRRARVLAYGGMLTSALFLLVIMALGLPVLLLDPCR